MADTNQCGVHVTVEQGETRVDVDPLMNDESITEFYDYTNSSVNTTTGIERSDVSSVFLYDGPDGRSLGIIHDSTGDDDA